MSKPLDILTALRDHLLVLADPALTAERVRIEQPTDPTQLVRRLAPGRPVVFLAATDIAEQIAECDVEATLGVDVLVVCQADAGSNTGTIEQVLPVWEKVDAHMEQATKAMLAAAGVQWIDPASDVEIVAGSNKDTTFVGFAQRFEIHYKREHGSQNA